MIDAAIRDRMKSARYLAVLGTKEEVDGALDAIKAEGLDLKIVSRGEFRGRAWQGYLIALGVLR